MFAFNSNAVIIRHGSRSIANNFLKALLKLKDTHPFIQSAIASFALIVGVGTAWHTMVFTPLQDQVNRDRTTFERFESEVRYSLEGISETLTVVKVDQARLGVNIDNLARSIDRLVDRIDRQPPPYSTVYSAQEQIVVEGVPNEKR